MKRIFLSILLLATMCCGFAYAQEVHPVVVEDENQGKPEVVETYYENGSLKSRGIYKWGRKNGVFREYYRNGQVKSISLYNQDKLSSQNIFENKDPAAERRLEERGADLIKRGLIEPKEKEPVDVDSEVSIGINVEGEIPQEVIEKKVEHEAKSEEEKTSKNEKRRKKKYSKGLKQRIEDSKKEFKEKTKYKKRKYKFKEKAKYEKGKYTRKLNIRASSTSYGKKISDKYVEDPDRSSKKYKKKKFVNTKPDGVY